MQILAIHRAFPNYYCILAWGKCSPNAIFPLNSATYTSPILYWWEFWWDVWSPSPGRATPPLMAFNEAQYLLAINQSVSQSSCPCENIISSTDAA